MKTTRKCFALVLVLLMVMSSFTSLSFTVSAAEAESTEHRVFPRFEISKEASKYGKLNMYTNGALKLDRSPSALRARKADNLPTAYSSVDLGYITSVKNQGSYGTCWAFAANAASEASLIKNNGYPKNSTSFSPAHTAWWTYSSAYDELGMLSGDKTALVNGETAYDNGGLSAFAAYTFAKGTGPAKETSVPYGTYAGKTVPTDKSWQVSDGAQLKNAYWVSYQNREDIKRMLMEYGAGVFGYYSSAGSNYEKSGTYNGKAYTSYAYVQSVSPSSSSFKYSDHDVTLVGWDDNFPKENFASACGVTQNGAWLIKNSWGTSEGASGYFWISYQDSSNLQDDACFFEYETEAPYENIYQYDGTSSLQYSYDDGGYMANVFTADSNETLEAVSFFTLDANVNYAVEIYKNVSTVPTSGTKVNAATVSGTTTYMQYKTVELPEPVQIDKNEKYAVVVRFQSGSGSTAYLPVDCTHRLYDTYQFTNATTAGISYYSSNKSTWTDVSTQQYTNTDGTKESNYSFRIKALTNERATALTGIELDKTTAAAPEGSKVKLTASAVPSEASLGEVTWTTSNSSVATVANGIVTCVAEGTATITASCGGFSATCTVTVTAFEGGFTPVTKQSDVRNNSEIMLVSEYDSVKYALKATAGAANNTLAGYVIEDSAIAGNTDETLIWIAEANGDGTYKLKSKSEGTYLTLPSSGNGLSLGATGTNLTLNESLFFGTSAKGVFFVNASLAYKSAALSNATSSSYTVPVTYVYKTDGGDPLPEYTVSFETDGHGTVTCNGVSYSNGQSVSFEEGTSVTLTAVPSDGYEIDEWLVGSETPSGATYTFIISENTEVTALFKSIGGDPVVPPSEGEYVLCNDAELESGRYIFVAENNGTKYAMTGGGLVSSKFNTTEVTVSNNIVQNPSATFAFDIVNTGSGYTVYDVAAEKYVGYSSSTTFTETDTPYKFNVEYYNGLYKVIPSTGTTRAIILTVTGMQFGSYAMNNIGASYKLPALYKLTDAGDLPEPVTQYDITLDITGSGTIGYNNNSYSNGQKITVDEGTVVTLTAVAAEGYQLSTWLDNDGNTISGTSYTTTVNSNITITAEFTQLPQKAAAVTAYPVSGKIESGTTVYLSCSTPDSTIHYSYDGVNYSTYSNGAIVAATFPLTVYAYATADGYDNGDVATFTYTEKTSGGDASGEYVLCTDTTLTDGKYIIAALVDGTYYAMLGDTLASGKLSSQEITVTDGTIQDATDEMVFEIAATSNGYSVYDTTKEQFVKYNGTSGTNLAYDNSAYDFSVTYENDVYKILSTAVTTRGIIYRAGTTNKFGGYSTSNISSTGEYHYLTLFKLDEGSSTEEKFNVSISIYGNGTVDYNGQSYSNGDTISINKFSEVTLTATPATGYELASWVVGDVYPEDSSYTFTLSEDTDVIVQFSEATADILATVNGGQGTVLVNGDTANDIITVALGSEVNVTAVPAEEYTFSYMTVNGTSYETANVTFTISADTEIEVYFVSKYDFNSDSELTMADVTYLLDYFTGKIAEAPAYADVNGDEAVNLLDAYVLYTKVLAGNTANAAAKGVSVTADAFNNLAADEAESGKYVLCTDETLETGKYIFVADYNGTMYAMTGGTLSSGKLTGTVVTIENNIVTEPADAMVFDVTKTDDGYTVYDNASDKYLSFSSSSNFTENTNPYIYNVTYADGTYSFVLSTATTRAILLNSSSFKFGPYATSNTGYKYPALYKLTDEGDIPEPATQYNITLDITGNGTIGYKGNSYSNGQKITVNEGTSVTLTPVAAEGWELSTWLDNDGNEISGTSYTTTVNGNITITAEFTQLPQKAAAVTAYPASGKIQAGTTVYLSCSTPDSTIHYSYDGVNYSTYSNGAIVAATFPLTVYAYATADGFEDGDVATFEYTEKTSGGDASGEYTLCTDTTLTDGKYIIAALVDGTYYAMLGDTLASGKLSSQEITVTDGTVQDATDEMVFEIAATSNGYSIYDTTKEQFVKYNGTSGTNLAYNDSAYDFSVTYEDDVYKILSTAVTTRGIIFRAGSTNKFGGYATSNVTATGEYHYLTLFKLDETTAPSEDKYAIDITVYGSGTVDYNGQSYSNGDTVYVDKASEVTLTVTPATGYQLASWAVGEAYPENSTYTFTINEDTEVVAQFSEITADILATVNGGEGTVLVNGDTANDVITVAQGSEVTVTAVPAENYVFSYMTVNGTRYETANVTFTISADTEIEVYFIFKYDFNNDGQFTLADATYLLDYLTGNIAEAPAYADVNGDEAVNLLDAYILYALIPANNAVNLAVRGDTVSTGAFEKVTDATTLAAGDQIIFVYNDKMMDSTFSSGKTVGLDVEHRGDYIANVDTSAIWTVAIDTEATDSYKYSFLAPDGTNYLTYDTSTNFKLASSLGANNKFAINTYTAPFTSEELYEIGIAAGRDIVYRTGTTNKFAAYAKSNLTNATNSKEYFGVYIYKYNPNLTFGDEQYTVTVSVAEGQEALGTVNEGATVYAGSNYTVTATPAEGYMVSGWTITAQDGTVTTVDTASYKIENINQNYTAVVSFEELPPQPVGKYVDVKATRNDLVVGRVKVGDVLRFSVNTPIVSTDLITYSYRFSEEAEWISGSSYTITASDALPLTIYVKAAAEGCADITGSKTFEAATAFNGTFQKVTDISTLQNGDKIVLAYNNVAFDSEKSDNKFIGSTVTVNGDYITDVEPTAVWVFGIDETASDKYKYTFESNETAGNFINNANSTTINIGASAGKYAIESYTNTVLNIDLFKIYNSSANRAISYRAQSWNVFNAYSMSNVKADSEEYFGLCIYKLVDGGETPEEPYDLTGDGYVDINDVKLICDYLVGLVNDETAVQKIESVCDFNENGIIDLFDAYYFYDTIVKDFNLPAE